MDTEIPNLSPILGLCDFLLAIIGGIALPLLDHSIIVDRYYIRYAIYAFATAASGHSEYLKRLIGILIVNGNFSRNPAVPRPICPLWSVAICPIVSPDMDLHSRGGAGSKSLRLHGPQGGLLIPILRTDGGLFLDKILMAISVPLCNYLRLLVRSLACVSQPVARSNHLETITDVGTDDTTTEQI
ncbi:hypothetical protein NA56DRAFT_357572 [Hyaloscypha hepaticicola]|uniref:Uncharacterized protein n=1 Tax=Hyaloscypha hepaticicola TaxID=2082293 RepID=A0A2J6PM75_9HELO|nr:hypothetical protein NA56DRAFT_357572 [Hyaloscypha hepaticicola]